MFTGPSISTRSSHQRAISSAWRLVSEAANLQPTLPVQATRPARIAVALAAKPSAAIAGRAGFQRLGRNTHELAPELLLDQREELVDAEGIEHVFEPRLGAIGAVAVVDEDADDGVGDERCFRRLHDDAGLAAEIAVA